MALRSYIAEEIAVDWSDGLLTRREALRRLGLMGFSLAGAAALLAACGGAKNDSASDLAKQGSATSAAPTTTTTTPAANPATSAPPAGVAVNPAITIKFPGPNGELQAAWATPADPKAGVLIVHENRSLRGHFYDLAGRLAVVGYAGLGVDLLSEEGGTAKLTDPAAPAAALAAAPVERLLRDLQAGIDELQRRLPGKPVGVVGFCFGGGMVWDLLSVGEGRLAAAVPFYGPIPDNPDFSKAKAAVLAIYAEHDTRVNDTRDAAMAALQAAGLTHEARIFPGTDHAFFNDTGPRYNAPAAKDAYAAMLDWFSKYLA